MLLLTLFAFIAGAGTALSPCSLPVLPALLSASATGGRRRPLGIVVGLAVTFCITITVLASVVNKVGLGDSVIRDIAIAALLIFGVALIVPKLSEKLEAPLARLSRLGPKNGGDGFVSGLFVGGALGFVNAPCAGPILAAVIAVDAATSSTITLGIAFSVGTALVLLVIALTGRKIVGRLSGARNMQNFQRAMGGVLVLTAIAMVFSLDVRFQQRIATDLPAFAVDPTSALETSSAAKKQLASLQGKPKFAPDVTVASASPTVPENAPDPTATVPGAAAPKGVKSDLPVLGVAPEFTGITKWLNGAPVTIKSQIAQHKVTLIDFWTYTCINCLRTLPYLKAWNERYADKGLTIIGVHAPEFGFEKKTSNVQDAIKRLGIKYPVAQDNDMATWNAWGNQYWPAEYLIDSSGKVRSAHFGEGDYDKSEADIKSLLAEAGQTGLAAGDAAPKDVVTPSAMTTPETYLGKERAMGWVDDHKAGTHTYAKHRGHLETNAFALTGTWNLLAQNGVAGANARIDVQFQAKNVYLVLAPPAGGGTSTVKVLLDGAPFKTLKVTSQKLYTLASLPQVGVHRLTLQVGKGTGAYAFTFG